MSREGGGKAMYCIVIFRYFFSVIFLDNRNSCVLLFMRMHQ